MLSIRPVGDHVVVKTAAKEEVTKSDIHTRWAKASSPRKK
jgi:co-chaperonin GroES (HSP10)